MPELPEMQALSERLDALLSGRSVARVTVLQFSALKTFEPSPETLAGMSVASVGRRGKYLVVELAGARVLVHLSQGGRVDVEEPPKATRPKGSVLRIVFDPPAAVLVKEYGTQRKAGWWILPPDQEGPLSNLGPEPGSGAFARRILDSDDARRLHTVLRDQRTVAGIGRGFADDILHEARLSPFATLKGLDRAARDRLLDAVNEVLERALERERARRGGLPAKLPDRFAVHGRAGSPCPRCGATLARVSYEDHEMVYCPSCQTGGRTLADRRLSRLIR